MSRIDAHVHVFSQLTDQFPREVDDRLSPDRGETAEKLLGEMEPHGIEQAMLVQIGGTSVEHHAYLQHCVSTFPDRFQGIGLIPSTGDPAIAIGYYEVSPGMQDLTVKHVLPAVFADPPRAH